MKPRADPVQPFRLGEWTVEPTLNRITRGVDSVQLEPKAMDVLVFLASHPGEVLSQQAIIDGVWATEFVGEGVLRRAITVLREALGDDARNPAYIETITKRGYRLIAEVADLEPGRPLPAESQAKGFRPRWTHALAVVIAAVIALLVVLPPEGIWQRITGVGESAVVRCIAVLPLDNLSGDPEQEYFADAMTEELITELARIGGFDRVISSTTSRRYKATDKTMPEIARELGVDGILEGGILNTGDQVRITAQLIHAPTDTHLWADSFQRDLTDVLALQAEIARAIADAITLQLSPEDEARLADTRQVDPRAYEAYLMGRYHWEKATFEGFEKSLRCFEQAVGIDPGYAAAYAGLADAHLFSAIWGGLPPAAMERAREYALRALKMDGSLSEAHAALAGVTAWWDWDWAGAEHGFIRAIELEPSSPWGHVYYAAYLLGLRRFDEAAVEAQRAWDLDPLNVHTRFFLGWTLTHVQRTDEAIELLESTLEIDENHTSVLYYLFLARASRGQHEHALDVLERLLATGIRGVTSGELEEFRRTRSASGWSGALEWFVRRVEARARPDDAMSFRLAAELNALAGNRQATIEWLERALEGSRLGTGFMNSDPLYEPLRSDPRFQDLLRRMNYPLE